MHLVSSTDGWRQVLKQYYQNSGNVLDPFSCFSFILTLELFPRCQGWPPPQHLIIWNLVPSIFEREKASLQTIPTNIPEKCYHSLAWFTCPDQLPQRARGLGDMASSSLHGGEESLKETSCSTTRRRNRQLDGPRQEGIFTQTVIWNKNHAR